MLPVKHHMPEDFFQEETRYGFTITKKRKEIWAVELDMLLELDRVCKELGIRYFLDAGTLLGAIRDGHFIPWDDDIDVVMMRDDYDRFTEQAPSKFQHPYFLQNAYTDIGYIQPHSQLRNSETTALLPKDLDKETYNQGIFIDIFVYDGINKAILNEQYKKRDKYYRFCHYLKWPERATKLKSKIRLIWLKIWYKNCGNAFRKIEETFRGNTDSEYMDVLMTKNAADKVVMYRRAWYDKQKFVKFEGIDCPVPANYTEALEVAYGKDWLTPRTIPSTHNADGMVYFDTRKSYKEYINNRT